MSPENVALAIGCLGACACAAGLAFFLRGRRVLAAAGRMTTSAERTLLQAQYVDERAGDQLAAATTMREEARRIEELLVRPRWSLNLQSGRIRALLHGEEPDLAIEVEAQAPDQNCECGGRGWRGRDRNTQRVIPCKCVKRELHRARLAAKG